MEFKIPIPKPPVPRLSPIFWICDCSESMGQRVSPNNHIKIDMINKFMPNVIGQVLEYSQMSIHSRLTMRALKFSDHAEWIDKENIPANHYTWKNLPAGGRSALGEAFNKLAQELKPIDEGGSIPSRLFFTPILVLITDGYPTDDWESGLKNLNAQFWGRNADRIAIVLEGAEENILRTFLGVDIVNLDSKLITIPDLIENRVMERILLEQYLARYDDRPYEPKNMRK